MKSFSSAMARIAAVTTAFALVAGTASCTANNGKTSKKQTSSTYMQTESNDQEESYDYSGIMNQSYYMSNAENYKQVYALLKAGAQRQDHERIRSNNIDYYEEDIDIVYEAELSDTLQDNDDISDEPGYISCADYESPMGVPFTDSILPMGPEKKKNPGNNYQEGNDFEAVSAKTDGKHIYYLNNNYDERNNNNPFLRVINVENGKFLGYKEINLKKDICDDDNNSIDVGQMFIYNKMIAVYGSVSTDIPYGNNDHFAFVAFYTTNGTPSLIDVYKQAGYYDDLKITTDGYLIIPSFYSSLSFEDVEDSKDIDNYIPCYSINSNYDHISPENILLPEEITASDKLKYMIIGSIDLNETGKPKICDVKAFAGCSGNTYITENSIYINSYSWDKGGKTDLTRISFENGVIAPSAGCTLYGSVNNSDFMYEENGHLCVAVNYAEYDETYHKYSDNEEIDISHHDKAVGNGDDGYYIYKEKNNAGRFYILDMDMHTVGSLNNIEPEKSIYTVDFVNNTAYIYPSYLQDKVCAIDFSSPEKPAFLDKVTIKGYSSYMQSWDENSLISLGESLNEKNKVIGLRLTMFDSTDPNELKTADLYTWDDQRIDASTWKPDKENPEDIYKNYPWSPLIIAPEKNIICIPLTHEYYVSTKGCVSFKATMKEYVFLSFENGDFVLKGDIKSPVEKLEDLGKNPRYDSALYIGDYIYMLSSQKTIATDINTIEITDELTF